jgi:hypothetical protein
MNSTEGRNALSGSKISIVLAATALMVSVLFATSLGQAASRLVVPKNSVGSAQIKKSAVTGLKVKNGTLMAADFKAGQLPRGPQGPKGDPGSQGANGDTGAQGQKGDPGATKVTRRSGVPGGDAGPGEVSASFASCQSGETIVGGGVSYTASGNGRATVTASAPTDAGKWTVSIRNDGASGTVQPYSYALCASP